MTLDSLNGRVRFNANFMTSARRLTAPADAVYDRLTMTNMRISPVCIGADRALTGNRWWWWPTGEECACGCRS